MTYDLHYSELNFSHKLDETPTQGPDFNYHYHTVYEMLLFLSGDVKFIHESKCYSLDKGDLIFVKPGQNHNICFNSFIPYERYVLKFPETEIPDELHQILQSKDGCYSVKNTILFDLFARLDYHKQHYGGQHLCELNKCVLKEILYYFCAEESASANLLSFNPIVSELVDYIDARIEKPITIEDICQHFHYSKSYIYKIFLDEMNVPIMTYIRTKKILYADSLIKRGMKPTEAFYRSGFTEYPSFYRAYLHIIGHKPSYNDDSSRITKKK